MPPGPKIFLSYRREDSAFQTTAIHEKLVDAFGNERVFMDFDSIAPGRDFRARLQLAISQCDVCLAVIGEHWLDAQKDGRRRLDDPRDFVRIEIESALSRDIPVIPLLLGSAVVPAPESLPESLRELSYRNALAIRPGRDFKNDIQALVSQIQSLPASPEGSAQLGESIPQVEPPPAEKSTPLAHPSAAGAEDRAIKQYYIRQGTNISGPLTSRALKELAASRMLGPDDEVSQDRTVWTVARKVRGLRFDLESPKLTESLSGEHPVTALEAAPPATPPQSSPAEPAGIGSQTVAPPADRPVQVPPWVMAAKARLQTPSSSTGALPVPCQPQPAKPRMRTTWQVGDSRQDNVLAMKFMGCPPGKFQMGSPPSELGRETDEDQVSVTLSAGFWLGKFPVTQGEWERLMRTSPWKGKVFVKEGSDYPATYINWDEANEFAERLNRQERKAGRLADDWSYALPTEAQWEYACRAETTSRFSFGDVDAQLNGFAWFAANTSAVGEEFAHRVGRKQQNAWGLSDMHGNVWEWCRDMRVEKLPGGNDPQVVVGGTERVCRGGGWLSDASNCRSAIRFGYSPVHRSFNLGFRIALSPSGLQSQ